MTDVWHRTITAYCSLFENLRADELDGFDDLCAPDIRFRDPFNDLVGLDRFKQVFVKMFEDVRDPRFKVIDVAHGEQAYLKWIFSGDLKGSGQAITIEGMTELIATEDGKVAAHIDHWDAAGQVYERIPVLGRVLEMVRRRMSI
jgi:hypothetical protein